MKIMETFTLKNLEVEVEGEYHESTPMQFHSAYGVFEPSEGGYFEAKHIWLNRKLDLISHIPEKEIEEIESEIYQQYLEDL